MREIRHLKREIDSYTAVTGKKKAPRPGRQTTNQPIIGVGSRYLDSPVVCAAFPSIRHNSFG